MPKERLHYIDVAKGLLIIMVVWGHYELMCRLCFGVYDPTINALDSVEDLWVSFFMPAFFFLTGYCTNFQKRFFPFLLQGIKILIVPALVINYSANVVEYLSWGESSLWILKTIVKSFLMTCAGEWFIPSLFLARLAVWGLVRINKNILTLSISFAMLCLGVILYDCFPQIPEIWAYKHALMVTIFVAAGNLLSNSRIQIGGGMQWVYLPLLALVLLSGTGIPYITNRVSVELWQIPVVLILALSGIFFIVFFSKKISSNKLLEYLGRNSLVIYLAHFIFYQIYLNIVIDWFNVSKVISAVLFFGIIIINIASCCLLASVLNTRYFKWILGKF